MGQIGDAACKCKKAVDTASELVSVASQARDVATTIRGMWGTTWPGDVKAHIIRLSAKFDATNRDVQACAGLTAADKAAWADLYGRWQKFQVSIPQWLLNALAASPAFPMALIQARDYEAVANSYDRSLSEWQDKLAEAQCKPSAPHEDKPAEVTPFDMNAAIRWGAIAVLALAGVYGLYTFRKVL